MKLVKNDLKSLINVFKNKVPIINDLLKFCTENKCSDLYLKIGDCPYISRYGLIYKVPCFPLTLKLWSEWAKYAITSENNAKYVRQKMLDFSYFINTEDIEYRYRVSAGFSVGKNIATFRMISKESPSFNNINFPLDIINLLKEIAFKRNKITIFVGPTGSGKSVFKDQEILVNNKTIKWSELSIGDIFPDNSIVKEIMPWEYRKCFELISEDKNKIIVSDDHLIHCYFSINGVIKHPKFNYNGIIITDWATSDSIFKIQNENANNKIYLIQSENITKKLFNIQEYDNGEIKEVRCIKTNTGQYKINDFINHNTTTMAACINDFSKPGGPFNNSVIISLEDPIEYIYEPTQNVNIIQKELGADFKEFKLGVKQSLREHPNFINVGETRDKETINTLVEASRTGHGVYTSFHSKDVAETISRLYNYLVGDNSEIMYDLIANINMIICQKLISNGEKFELKTQYMVFTDEIVRYLNNMIISNKNIPNTINELFGNKELLKYKIVKNWS